MDNMSDIGNNIRLCIMDCLAFITLGTCYYGKFCRYNHPNHEEVAANCHRVMSQSSVTRCQFFFDGFCKYGASCRFSHSLPVVLNPLFHLNALGLPKRLGAITCSFYMRNGICGFGVACKYDHPEPVNHQNELDGNGYGWNADGNQYVQWPEPNFYFPSAESREYENGYHGVTNDGNANGNQYHQHPNVGWTENQDEIQARTDVVVNDCVTLSDVGLPLRHGKKVCLHYERLGLCKYGHRCKFDHPVTLSSNEKGSIKTVSSSKTHNAEG